MKYILIILLLILPSCTDNTRAKSFGGTVTVDLESRTKLVNITWKEDQMWILTKPMIPSEQPETYTFKEKSTYGLVEGTVIIQEKN